ncbi:1-aminocyclopropane-1-carboxylate synthase-like protein 2 [Camelus ferus]|nr:1-aminocyclopropane-1-carboxylate synthase-like protein 2 [Camelus ferus]
MSIQSRSNPSDIPHMSDGQVWDQAFRNHSIHTCLMEMVLSLQQAVADHITQLATRHQQQDLVPEEQGHNQPIWGQEALLGRLMFQMVNHLQFGATGGQKFQPPCPSEDSKGDVRSREQAQVSKQIYKIFYQLTNFEDTSINYVLSNRGVETSALYHGSFQDYNTYQGNKYHEDKNTLLSRSDMNYIDDDLLQYSDWRGQPFLREEVAQFLTYYCKAPAPLDPENVVVLNGCSSVFSALATVLCDPGEAFLVPTPTYSDFVFSAHLYAKVDLVPVDLESQVSDANTHPFQLTVDKLEQALLNAKLEGKKVRGLVLINPQNPLGHIYSQDSLMEYLEFAKKHSLHVIIDEIYMLSVFDESITFRSVLSMESLPDPNKTHMIWGTSKDFGISGFRFGTLYTHNKEVALAMSSFGYLHGISGITQYKLHRLLQDREWIDNVYLPTNHSRLQEAHRFITNELKSSKIPFLSHGSGLYVWISLRKYLDPCTFEEELLLHRRFLDKKLILSCGKTFMCKEPGWFRLVFAATPLLLKHAMQRFYTVLVEQEQDWMFTLPQKESRKPTTCPGSVSTRGLHSIYGDGLEREAARKPDQKLLYGVGDPTAMFSSDSPHLSSRGSIIKWFWDSAEEGYRTYHMDEYDEDKNPGGIINLGTSENKLCFDLLSRRLSHSDMLRVEPSLLQYPDWRGHLFLREEVASFLSFYCKSPAPLKPENVVVLNGCASLFSALATVLCEVGEAFLIPAPYYGAITQHVYLYGNVRLVCVYLDSEGVKVKGLILINPQNPLGDIYSPGELREYLEFAKRHALHVMVDEVYMLSVFEESVGYRSVLSLEGLPDPQKTHVMWATSKDFGMSGLRFGTLYTENQDVATAVASLCRYHGLSGFVQYQMAQLLRDRDWINQVYLPENHARLKAAHTYVSEELRAMGVPFLSHGAGFFIWVDLRKFLPEATFEEERLLWRRFLENKVLLSFGKAFECKEPGWFRLVFSDKAHRLRLGMQRIRQVLEGKSQVAEDPPSCQTQEPRGPHRRTAPGLSWWQYEILLKLWFHLVHPPPPNY